MGFRLSGSSASVYSSKASPSTLRFCQPFQKSRDMIPRLRVVLNWLNKDSVQELDMGLNMWSF